MQPVDNLTDIDASETQEWIDALDAVIKQEGPQRAHFLMEQLIDKARRSGAYRQPDHHRIRHVRP